MDIAADKRPPSRILIIKLSALGDVVQSLPVLHALKATWPDASVDWITGEVGSGLLEGNPLIHRVLVYRRKELGKMAKNPFAWPALVGELINLRHKLKLAEYDIAIDLQGLFKSGLITFLCGAQVKAGFDKGREMSHIFLNRKLPPYDPDKHAVLRYLELAEHLGARVESIRFPLYISDREQQKASELLGSIGLNKKNFVVLVPGTVWPTKRWKSSSFGKLAKAVYEELGIASIIAGGRQDRVLGEKIVYFSGGCAKDLTGRTNLKVLAALFKKAVTAVSTDTGPMHLAAATGLGLVALFGPTAPWRTGPFGKGHVVIRKGMKCSPCFKRRCNSMSCMRTIEVEEVFEAVKDLCKKRLLKLG